MPLLRELVTRVRQAPPLVAGNRPTTTFGSLMEFMGQRAKSGSWVDQDTALTVSAWYRAVTLISTTIGAMPLHVYTKNNDGSQTQIQMESERYIWGRPNPEVSRSIFWETLVGHCLTTGNAYAYVVTVPDRPSRRPVELWPVEPSRVKVGRAEDGRKFYDIDNVIQTDYVNGGNIVHFQGFGSDGLRGLSVVRLAAQSLGLALAAEDFGSSLFRNGSTPAGYLSSDQELTEAQATAMGTWWDQRHAGAANAGKTAVFGKGTKWNAVSLPPEDAQMLETRRFQISEVARWFGIPPHMLGDVEKTTSWGSGIEEQGRGFVTYTLQPWLVRFEQTISDELLRPQNHYARFDTGGLLRGSTLQRYQAYQVGINAGFLSVNDVRRDEDLPPVNGGDTHLQPLNMAPLGTPPEPAAPAV